MARVVTVADLAGLSGELLLAPGEVISPQALDEARARGVRVRWSAEGAGAAAAVVPAPPRAASSPGPGPGSAVLPDRVTDAVVERVRGVVRSALAAGEGPAGVSVEELVGRVVRELSASPAGVGDGAAADAPGPWGSGTVTQRLARFVVDTARRGVPPEVRHETARAVLNVLAASLAAADHEVTRILDDWVATEGPPGPGAGQRTATVLWRGTRTLSEQAAFINAARMHVLDFDDTHIPTYSHPSAQVFAAALAEGEVLGSTGRELLVATAVGMEVQLAVARMLFPSHYLGGYHITSTLGGLGAAAACSVLRRLDLTQVTNALGIASLAAGGLLEAVGTMSNAFDVGHSARTGAVAAQLAELGFDSAPTAVEGTKGLLRTTSDEDGSDVEEILAELGGRWEMLTENSFKRFPTETITQAPLECVLAVLEAHPTRAGDVDRIVFRVEPIVAEVCATRPERWTGGIPRTSIQAKFDLRHCVAAAWLRGRFGHHELEPDCYTDPVVIDLRSRVDVVADPAVSLQGAVMEVTFTDGTCVRTQVEAFTGSAANPMPDALIETKFLAAAEDRLPGPAARIVLERVWALDDAPDLRELIEVLR